MEVKTKTGSRTINRSAPIIHLSLSFKNPSKRDGSSDKNCVESAKYLRAGVLTMTSIISYVIGLTAYEAIWTSTVVFFKPKTTIFVGF
jgi:hypothetical protein